MNWCQGAISGPPAAAAEVDRELLSARGDRVGRFGRVAACRFALERGVRVNTLAACDGTLDDLVIEPIRT